MSIRVYTSGSDLHAGILVGNRGLGVKGSAIPNTGGNGPALAYPFITLPADNNAEFSVEILTWPSQGTLFVNDDSSFTFDPGNAPDGVYPFTWRLRKDGVVVDDYTTDLVVGSTTVAAELAGSFAALATAAATLNGQFSAQAAVGVNLAGTFAALATVSANLSGAFAVLAPVSAELAGTFGAATVVGVSLAGEFSVDQPGVVGITLAGQFAVEQTVAAALAGNFGVLQTVAVELAGQYAAAEVVSAELGGQFAVIEPVGIQLAGGFAVLQTVGTTLAGTFTAVGQGGGADPSQVWAFVLPNGKSAGQTLMDLEQMVLALYRIHGLEPGSPLVVTKTSRAAGGIEQSISSTDSGTTVERQ
jgi:hypothetical protein